MKTMKPEEIAVKKLTNVYAFLIVFIIVDVILIMIGDRPKGQWFIEYAAWTTIGLVNLIVIVIILLLCLGWAAG